jgi:predicted HAD superfamily hydrolase
MERRLQDLLDRARCLSLDVFDTAVVRLVPHPTDVFRLVAAAFLPSSRLNFDYLHGRVEAERQARDHGWRTRGRAETTLDEIYQCLTERHVMEPGVAETLKRLEVEVELAICTNNPAIEAIYRDCREHGKTLVFASDMYLPFTVVKRILEGSGYGDHDRLFLSSDLGITKSTGELYERMLGELGCPANEVLHIGDNYDSDFVAAQRCGLMAYQYRKCVSRVLRNGGLRKPAVRALQRKGGSPAERVYLGTLVRKACGREERTGRHSDDGFWYDFGYQYVGILFLGFAQWLLHRAQEDAMEKLFFLSRDGYIVKQCYDLLAQTISGAPVSEYMYASRRALNVPVIDELDDHTMDFLLGGTSTLSVSQFLGRAGLDPAAHLESILKAGFRTEQQPVVNGTDYANLRSLYGLLIEDIKRVAAAERGALMTYLDQIGMLGPGRFGIVDIGWHGTLQHSIGKIVRSSGGKGFIKGYYLATYAKARALRDGGQEMSAYLCELGLPERHYNAIRLCVEIFEFVHSAPHGSVIRFVEAGGNATPVFDENDLGPEKIAKAQMVQRGALDFIADSLKTWDRLGFLRVSRDLAIGPLVDVLKRPSHREAVLLGDLEHAEGFGNVYVKRHIARPPALTKVLGNPYALVEGYRRAFWRKGYRKRILSVGGLLGRWG